MLKTKKFDYFENLGRDIRIYEAYYDALKAKVKRNTEADQRVDYTKVFNEFPLEFKDETNIVCASIGGGGYYTPETLLKALYEGGGAIKFASRLGKSNRPEKRGVKRKFPWSERVIRNVRPRRR